MNIINVKKLPSMFEDQKVTSITFSQDDSVCNIEVIHSPTRIIYSWRVTNLECDLKFTDGQITMLLHKALDNLIKRKPPYYDIVVAKEDREKFGKIINAVMKRMHFHYSNDQKFHCEIRSTEELYQEMNYILTE